MGSLHIALAKGGRGDSAPTIEHRPVICTKVTAYGVCLLLYHQEFLNRGLTRIKELHGLGTTILRFVTGRLPYTLHSSGVQVLRLSEFYRYIAPLERKTGGETPPLRIESATDG